MGGGLRGWGVGSWGLGGATPLPPKALRAGWGLPAGVFHLGVPLEALFFVGNQLIATSHTGKIGVWNAVTKHWQVGDGGVGWGSDGRR